MLFRKHSLISTKELVYVKGKVDEKRSRRVRRLLGPSLISAVALVSTLALPRGAFASTCNSSGCYNYSYATAYPTSGALWTLGWWNTYFLNYTSSDGDHGHLSQVNWDSTSSSTYVEVGLTAAFNSLGCSGYCSQPYWEDVDTSGNFYPHTLNVPFPFADGVERYYLIASRNDGSKFFDLYTSPVNQVSWTYQGTSTNQPGSTITRIQVGMEDHEGAPHSDYSYSQIDPDENSAGFDAGIEALVNGSWQTLNMNVAIDAGCNGHNNGYCLNGTSYGISEYSDNKP